MNIIQVRKKQMKGASGPQLYTCTVEFTEDELEKFTDNMVVEVKPGVAEDLSSFILSKFAKEMATPYVPHGRVLGPAGPARGSVEEFEKAFGR